MRAVFSKDREVIFFELKHLPPMPQMIVEFQVSS
jgi:hypothetical protein